VLWHELSRKRRFSHLPRPGEHHYRAALEGSSDALNQAIAGNHEVVLP